MGKPNVLGAALIFAGGIIAVYGHGAYLSSLCPEPKPVQVKDVNGDGIEDKVVQEKVIGPEPLSIFTPFGSIPNYLHVREETFFGIGVVNGKPVYLSKPAFEAYIKATRI